MSQLMDAAEHSNIAFPELTVSSAAGHCTEEEVVDFNDFSNLIRGNEGTLSSSSINSNEHTFLELEGQGSRTLCKVSHLGRHLLEMPLEMNLILDGGQLEVEAI